MKNIEMTVEGKRLTIVVDLSQEHGTSKSGKSITIARTQGGVPVPGHEEIVIGFNVYRPDKRRPGR